MLHFIIGTIFFKIEEKTCKKLKRRMKYGY